MGLTMNRTGSVIFTSVAVLLAACVGSTAVAGIQGSGKQSMVAFGRVTGFGSVFVNGVEYSTTGAQILIDGHDATESQLNTGDVVTIQGTVNDDGITGTATQVSFTGNVRGPITGIGLMGNGFTVLGQSVLTNASTIFGDGSQPPKVGAIVEVSGLPDGLGNIVASRVDLKPAASDFQVVGVVNWLDTNAHTFQINNLTIDYGAAAGTVALANGSTVEVHGANLTANGALLATDLEAVPAIAGVAGEQADLEGVITGLTSLTNLLSSLVGFILDGQQVTIDSTTALVLHGLTLAPGVAVDVQGEFDASGTLHARKIEVLPLSLGLLGGLIDSITPMNNTMSVLGVNIKTGSSTVLNDRSSQPVRQFRLTDLHVGDYVEVAGSPTGASVLTTSRVERRNIRPQSILRGIAHNLTQPDFTVLGVTVATTAQTQFTGPGGVARAAADFFAQAADHIVEVKGTYSGGVLTAESAHIER